MPQTQGSGQLKARGIDLAYQWHGPRAGVPFVLVHGFTGSSDDWADHVEALAELAPTVTIDLRGHGESTNLKDESAYSLAHLVDDLSASLDELEIDRCDLLGHSMGGMAALRFALAHPDRLRSLILMDTSHSAVELAPPAVFEQLIQFVRGAGTQGLLQTVRARADEAPDAAKRYRTRVGEKAAWSRIENKLRQMDPEAFIGFARTLGDQDSMRPRLGEIRCPTLVMVGDEDEPFLEPTEVMAREIPNAEKIVIRGAAHSPQLEEPDAWLAAIAAHLERARNPM